MYAVVSSGGKQYRVEPGSTLLMERLASQPGGSILFDRVLLIGDGDDVTVGTPVVAGASVSGTVLGEELGPKLVIFKFKQKVKYRRRTGHRQHLLRVRIDEINAEGRPKARAAKAKPEADVEAAAETAAAPVAKAAAKPAPKPRASRSRAVKAAAPAEATEDTATAQPEAEASAEAPKPKRRSPRPKAEKAKE
ncbi:MAG TPA: 50S ribosomal protein L21 [Candidatus Limnocylindrales bacterium]|nr:50S ribosomal protein L21 [Candidatus Limnocylindrales bacterium]